MSDNSYDSDSDDADNIEVVVPKTTYQSLTRRSAGLQPRENTFQSLDSTTHDTVHSSFAHQTVKSNFPPDFDEKYKFGVPRFQSYQTGFEYRPGFNIPAQQGENIGQPSLGRGHQLNQTSNQPYFIHTQKGGSNGSFYSESIAPGKTGSNFEEFKNDRGNGVRTAQDGGSVGRYEHSNHTRVYENGQASQFNRQFLPKNQTREFDNEAPYRSGQISQNVQPTYQNRRYEAGKITQDRQRQGNFQQNNNNEFRRFDLSQPPPKYITPHKLREWVESRNDTLMVFDISIYVDALSKFLKQESMTFESVVQMILILKKVSSVESQIASLNYIFKTVCKSRFLDVHLPRFLFELQQQRQDPNTFGYLIKIVDILEYFMKNMKGFSSVCKTTLQSVYDTGEILNLFTDKNELATRIRRLLGQNNERMAQNFLAMPGAPQHERGKRERSFPRPDDESPPDDYTEMTIFPDTVELNASVEPFLRANKTQGSYRDLQHYLDIHSRLMKEDYLSPIRTGLKNYKIALQNNSRCREDDLRFYSNVKIVSVNNESDQGISHFVTFDVSGFKNLEWEYSKRLMFGSLLVFSKDNFETTIFATVAQKDAKMLERGVLEVIFQNNLEEVFTSSENDTFIIAETTAYFESYRHVLEGLLELEKKLGEIPLGRYIISCKREIYIPDYISVDVPTSYNIASIMNSVYDHFPVPILNYDEWPDWESTCLNESQMEALKLALTKELALIQGPPGTGKTYVGLKIMRLLLENKGLKNGDKFTQKIPNAIAFKGPILVVCYTNHALDQFLEGMLEFCPKGIVRVGGRSSSERLECFNLKILRQNPSISGKIKASIHQNVSRCRVQLKIVSNAIKKFWQETLRLETTILSEQDLIEEINEAHLTTLTDPRRHTGSKTHVISTWLKASNASMDNHLNKAARTHLGKVIAKERKEDDIQNDSCLTGKKVGAQVDFQSRVKIYRYWLRKYDTFLEGEVEKLLSDDSLAPEVQQTRVQVLLDAKEEAHTDILDDDVLLPYMSSEKVFESVKRCVVFENGAEVEEQTYVRHWLLDKIVHTDELLDVIEKLEAQKPPSIRSRGQSRILADTESSAYKKRWIIDDSDSSDEGSSDDDMEDEGNLDSLDEESGKISDMKELENSYKQFQEREMILLQRARMLAIDLSEEPSDVDEWQKASNMSYSKVFHFYHKAVAFTTEEASQVSDVWSLSLLDRYRLYKFWVLKRKEILTNRLIELTEEYRMTSRRKKEALSLKDIEILKRATVIGMTTTGAARHRAVLQEVGCRVIVVEEAAEVLEAHIVTTLNSKCQHLILIGDHQQLRPNPTVHKLAIDYGLEISLFERLVKNNIPHVTLTEQHRMRPEISVYLRHIYPQLEDHSSVFGYGHVQGMSSDVFFIQHDNLEMDVNDTTSRANVHEAKFLTGLCKYLIQHEYEGGQITILAAYSGQVKVIREEMEKEESFYNHVRVTSIDNYQGEENDIVLLSLVRSNEQNEVGFLKVDNRVCVALSRAKMGLYAIGNFKLLLQKSKLWKNIVQTAKDSRVFGVGLKAVCVNHGHVSYIVNPEDFVSEVPEGGCNKQCEAELPCGHFCKRMCHSTDRYHETTKCMQPCMKQCHVGHPCPKDCYQECGLCEVRVTKRIPLCGHDDQVACYQDVEDVVCTQDCADSMACGHVCRGQCGICMKQGFHKPCLVKVDVRWPCGHTNNVDCSTDTSVEPCPTKCQELLSCGHKCKGTCGGCLTGRVHMACAEKCKKPLPCGHLCEGLCGGVCLPCKLRCPTSCRHELCNKPTCGELCEPCTENCALVCQHRKCSGLCKDECSEPACSKPCSKRTPCNHKCMSLCGEACVCYDCEKDKFDFIDFENRKRQPQWMVAQEKQERAKKFEIGKDTIFIKISICKHIFTLKQLDKYVQAFEPQSASFIRCPSCKVPLQSISRYEPINQQRRERRERRKADLIESTKVPKHIISDLTKSKRVLDQLKFCPVDKGDFLSRKPDFIDTNHALALAMQMRFAFALYMVHDIHFILSENGEFKVRKWINVVSLIQQSVTHQLISEMTLEFYRLLLCEQVTFLNRALKNTKTGVSDAVKANVKRIFKELSNIHKMSENDKVMIQPIVDKLFDELYTCDISEDWFVDAKSLQARVLSVATLLDQPSSSEGLITLLQRILPDEWRSLLERLDSNDNESSSGESSQDDSEEDEATSIPEN